MGHIHTQPGQVDQTVTAYIVRRDGDELYIMLHMHKKLHKLLPVGGHIELDETPWSAVAHEIEEESGYRLNDLTVLQPERRVTNLSHVSLHPQPIVMQTHSITSDHFHSDTSFLFEAHSMPGQAPIDGESDDIRWLTRDGIESLGDDELWVSTRQMCLAVFDLFVDHWQPVPATDFTMHKPVH